MLANELDEYKERGNSYIDENIQEIQELYTNEGQQKKEKERIEEEEVILIKPYDISSLMSSSSSSFANEKVNNLLKYIKFIKSPYTDKKRHCQVGSLAGAAHLLKDNAGVLRGDSSRTEISSRTKGYKSP